MKTDKILIIFLCLIATLSSVSGDSDHGTHEKNFFDWNKFSGPRPWYFLMHKSDGYENKIDCPISIFASPVGNISSITSDVYIIREQQHMIVPGYATNWNSSGYFDVDTQFWTGHFHVLAVDYDKYVIFTNQPLYTDEESLYVGYRTSRPDDETVEKVKQKLQEYNIDIDDLVELPVDHCQVPESSTQERSSNGDSDKESSKGDTDERKGT